MKRLFVLVCFLSIWITGCTLPLPGAVTEDADPGRQVQEVAESLAEAAEDIAEGSILEEDSAAQGGGADSTPPGPASAAPSETWTAEALSAYAYAYTQLSESERELYRVILDGLLACASDVPVELVDEDAFDTVFQCVMDDHPEIFYVDGYTFIKYTKGDTLTGNAFSGSYVYDQTEIAARQERIEEKTKEILDGLPAGGGEYEKVKYVYEYLVTHTEYVQGSEDNQNICSVFLNGETVCQGYAKAAQYLFREMEIDSVFVSGQVNGSEDHVWNLVKIDGDWYHVDITWGDASYVSAAEAAGFDGKLPEINYEYLCIPDSQILRTHSIRSVVPIPACDSMEANYYVREGAYFTEADMEKAAALFARAYENGTEYVTLKCADQAVYTEMERCLIAEQQVFRYLHTSDGTVAYTTNEKELHMSFWL